MGEYNKVEAERILEVENLRKTFNGEVVLDGISFHIFDCEKVVLFGYNGSGKTTLLRCILNYENYSGVIKILGVNADNANHLKRYIGYVPQVHPLWNIDILDLVKFALKLREATLEKFEQWSDYFKIPLETIKRKKFTQLSGGMRQKILLIFAFLGRPKILLLDEPFSNLDIDAQEKLFEFLKNSSGTAQIISTHRVEDVSFAQKVIHLSKGKIVNVEERKEKVS